MLWRRLLRLLAECARPRRSLYASLWWVRRCRNPFRVCPFGGPVPRLRLGDYWFRFASLAPSPTDQITRSDLPLSPTGNSICTSVVLAKNFVGDSANNRNLTPPTLTVSWASSRLISI